MYPDQLEKDFSPRNPVLDGVDPLIAARYSPRAFTKQSLSAETVNILFDAARQAPSCFNEQPWRFYCSSESSFEQFLSFLVPANAEWAKNSSLLFVVTANTQFTHNGKSNAHAWFDSGAAWYSLAYQARTMGLYTHAMGGIEHEKISAELELPDSEDVICAVAVGVADFDAAQQEEISARKSLDEILTIV